MLFICLFLFKTLINQGSSHSFCCLLIETLYSRKWVGGEVIQAVAYDVPIPGYKTKNTISLRLWEAKASAEDLNLSQFNDGQYESATLLHSRAHQVSYYLTGLHRLKHYYT